MRKVTKLLVIMISIGIAGTILIAGDRPAWPKAVDGSIDLTNIEFDKDTSVMLEGEWAFYGSSFMEPGSALPKGGRIVEVPGSWNAYLDSGEKYKGMGYGTYVLQVAVDLEPEALLGLKIHTFSSAYRLYIDDRLIAENGMPAKDPQAEIGEFKPQAVVFDPPDQEFNIILHVSNHQLANGGFVNSIELGDTSAIISSSKAALAREVFIVSILLIAAFFNLSFYFIIRDAKDTAYYAVYSVLMIALMDIEGQLLLLGSFLQLSQRMIIIVWYSAYFWHLFVIQLTASFIYPSAFSRSALKYSLALTAILQVLFIVLPPIVLTRQGILLILSIVLNFALVLLFAHAAKLEKRDPSDLGATMLVLMMTINFSYILIMHYVIIYPYIAIIYFLQIYLIAFQVFIVTKQFRHHIDQEITYHVSFLQAQIKPHFIYNVLNTILGISFVDVGRMRELIASFASFLRRAFDFHDVNQLVSLRAEIELASHYIKIENTRFSDKIKVRIDIREEHYRVTLPSLILQPLIENAVLHGLMPKSVPGSIIVSTFDDGKHLNISISDDGVGIEQTKLRGLLASEEHSAGIGIRNVHMRLKHLYGHGLVIESSADSGTTVRFKIPMEK